MLGVVEPRVLTAFTAAVLVLSLRQERVLDLLDGTAGSLPSHSESLKGESR
jgi:hypothetical protein